MKTTNERKHCPFCKSTETYIEGVDIGNFNPVKYWVVYCRKCGAKTGLKKTKNDAEKAWNRRDG